MEVKVAPFGEGRGVYRPDPKPPEKFLLILNHKCIQIYKPMRYVYTFITLRMIQGVRVIAGAADGGLDQCKTWLIHVSVAATKTLGTHARRERDGEKLTFLKRHFGSFFFCWSPSSVSDSYIWLFLLPLPSRLFFFPPSHFFFLARRCSA